MVWRGLFIAATASGALALAVVGAGSVPADLPQAALLTLATALLAWLPLRIGRFSAIFASDAPLVAGILLLPPGAVSIVALVGLPAAFYARDPHPVRVLRRVCSFGLSAGTASLFYSAAAAASSEAWPIAFGPALGAALLYVVLGLSQAALAAALDRRPLWHGPRRQWWVTVGSARLLLAVAAAIITAIDATDPTLAFATVPILALFYLAVRSRFAAERRVHLLTTLVQVGRALGATLDPQEVFRTTAAQVRGVMDADSFYVALYHPERNVLQFRYLLDGSVEREPLDHPVAGTLAGVAIERRAPLLLRDVPRERVRLGLVERPKFVLTQGRSVMVAPMLLGGRVVGAISTQSVEAGAYEASDRELLMAIAAEVAVAIERADLHARAASLSRRLVELHRVGLELAGHRELPSLARVLAESAQRVLGADGASVYVEARDGLLEYVAGTSGTQPGEFATLRRDSLPGGLRIDPAHPLEIPDVAVLPLELQEAVVRFDRRAIVVQPLTIEREAVGALVLTWRLPHLLADQDREIIGVLAGIGATAMRSTRLYRELDDAYVSTVTALTAAIEARDHYGEDHQRRVAADALALGERLGLSEGVLRDLRYAAFLYALGKIAVPAAILAKPGPLTPEERDLVHEHPLLGARVLEAIPLLRGVVPIVRHANERWDGSGYPGKLRGNDIPYAARILQIAISHQAMLSARPYRPAMPEAAALAELRTLAGVRYDPVLVLEFTRMVEARGTIAAAEAHVAAATTRELTILAQITPEFHTLLDVQSLLDRILAILANHLAGARLAILLEEEETRDLVVRALGGARSDLTAPTRLAEGRGLQGWVIKQREAVLVEDVRTDPRYVGDPAARCEVIVPLISNGRIIGVLSASHTTPGAFDQRDLALLQTVGAQIAAAIDVASLHERLKKAANTDALTGIHNYGYFFQRLEEEVARAERRSTPLAMAFLDVDDLKAVNDTHGHVAGNAVLRTIGRVIESRVRTEDVPARYGGDEFAIVMPDTPREEAERVVQRLIDALASVEVQLEGGATLRMPSLSWGVSAFPRDGRDARALVENADTRVYARKRAGR